jgi:hypothetical protein
MVCLLSCLQSTPRDVELVDGDGKPVLMTEADGLLFSRNIPLDVTQRVHTFRARDDDIVLATYPKCGTYTYTYLQEELKTLNNLCKYRHPRSIK